MKTQQFELFHEDIYSALRTCVDALGGPKEVGVQIWGKSQAANKLGEKITNCLNPNHSQKFSLDEVQWLLKEAHRIGCHAGINFFCRDAGYTDPNPLEPEEEAVQLMRLILKGQEELKILHNRFSAITPRAK